MPAPQEILNLIERFEQNRESYMSGDYKEATLRAEFIDPFFNELGWDMYNKSGYAEAYKDVVHEDSIKIGTATKAPDLCFRIGGVRKFFNEIKKPSVNIKDAISPAYQLRRYGWSSKISLSILTDFEEFAVYDCRIKPDIKDSAAIGRIIYLNYNDYPKKWDEINSIFSRESILKGSFDKFAEGVKGKKGTVSVDDSFLSEIENWREILAKNIAIRNSQLTTRELNFAVQKTIDRIIFLRICEDRGIELYGKLQSLINGERIYERVIEYFRTADTRYNSGLFHFQSEKNIVEEPDYLTQRISIDDKILKQIIGSLYYPECPFEFSVLPADILGQVYERFLGKVIRLTEGHQAKVEEKPEVRKAGGVYYTPTYIEDYIVENTVCKLLEGRKLDTKAPLRVADISCGSGSFLIVAYQKLLDWYLKKYTEKEPEKYAKGKNPRIRRGRNGEWKLTINERKRILLEHIYGVDIDSQAVEVTKLSLLLKVLEGENEEIFQGMLFQERALPDLGSNIKCGNSLIGSDFYANRQADLFNEDEMIRVNAFDWESQFSEVFKDGGFDAIIGNPPYIRIQIMQGISPEQVEYLKNFYKSASSGNYDIYVTFVEKGLGILGKNGKLGFILPHKFFNAKYGEPLRHLIAEGKHLNKIIHFGDQQVFSGATTYTCLFFLDKAGHDEFAFEKVQDLDDWRNQIQTSEASLSGNINAHNLTRIEWNFTVGENKGLFEKLFKMPIKLENIADRVFQGLVTGADSVFILKDMNNGKYFSTATGKEYAIEEKLMHLLCKGSVNIRRYHISDLEKSILFPYKLVQDKAILLSPTELETEYPIAWQYLKENRILLENREKGKWKHEKWYALGRSQNLAEMEQKKILTPSIANHSSFTLDSTNYYYFIGSGGGGGGGYGITLKDNCQLSYEYVLGLLNSQLLDKYLKSFSSPFSGGYYAFNRQYIEKLPIRLINFSDTTEKSLHDKISPLVTKMLELNKKFAEANVPDTKTMLQRQIEATDNEIDRLVYELYGLTADEIKIVEGENI